MALPAGRKGVRPDQIDPNGGLIIPTPTPYTLPTASAETKGGVKVGSGLSMDGETLNATGYTLPTASAETKGGVKVGTGLEINDGVLSVTAELPAYTSADSGRVLSVNSSGELEWKSLG